MTAADERSLLEFARQVASDVRERAMGGGDGTTDFQENAFTTYVSDHLEETGDLENPVICYHEGRHGRRRMGVNGYAVSEDKESLVLMATVFTGDAGTTVARDQIDRAARGARAFFEAAVAGLDTRMDPATEVHAMAHRVREVHPGLARLRILVLTDGRCPRIELEDDETEGVPTFFEVWEIERLFRSMQAPLAHSDIMIDFEALFGEPLPCLQAPDAGQDYKAFVTIIPAQVLNRLYDDFGPRLLELNVRSFLQARGKVNRGIRDTLRAEPLRFLAYNNGISITVTEATVTKKRDGSLGIARVKGFQIVNGGQTTASLHRVRAVDRADLSVVHVAAKITVIAPELIEQMVPLISRYANTQNVVQVADFSANDQFHVQIERLSRTIWCPGERTHWFYERGRGQYEVARNLEGTTAAKRRRFDERTPPSQKFTKTDLAKFVHSWDQKPHLVSRGAQKNFVEFMQALRLNSGQSWTPDDHYYKELIALAILFKGAARIVRDEGFAGYGANIVTYLVAYLSHRSGSHLDLERIWREQSMSDELRQLLREWSREIAAKLTESAGSRNVTEWCKREECWTGVKQLELEFHALLPPELTSGGTATRVAGSGTDGLTREDFQNIAACKVVAGEVWLRVAEWGHRTALLQRWQCGVAKTLAGYAATGWDKEPSVKQARQAVKILAIVRDNSGPL